MSLMELLTALRASKTRIWTEGDDLHIENANGGVPEDLLQEARSRECEILRLLKQMAPAQETERMITPIPRTGEMPLSFSEERLWFINQLEPHAPVYNIAQAFTLRGALDIRALEKSVERIIHRHESLRTTFISHNGKPMRVIADPEPYFLPITNLNSASNEADKEAVDGWVAEKKDCHFDLEQGPLFRVDILRFSDEEHILTMVMHHIISDGWSIDILWRELSELYDTFRSGLPSQLADLPIQYADYAGWQRSRYDDMRSDQLDYWRGQLQEAPRLLKLPLDRPRPYQQRYRGGRISLSLPPHLNAQIHAIGRQERATHFMTLLTAFKILLHRYTAEDHVVVGSPIANRTVSQIEDAIGFFVNTLVLNTDFSGNPTFNQLLARVRNTALDAFANQDLPFEKLVEELQPVRSLSHSPLFQVMFTLHNAHQQDFSLAGLETDQIQKKTQFAKFDLTLNVSEREGVLHTSFGYDSDLFEADTICRMSHHFQTLLESIVADPTQPISLLPILTQAEREQMLIEWNGTAADYPSGDSIHHCFTRQANRTPNSIALIAMDRRFKYREIEQGARSPRPPPDPHRRASRRPGWPLPRPITRGSAHNACDPQKRRSIHPAGSGLTAGSLAEHGQGSRSRANHFSRRHAARPEYRQS